MRYHCANPAMLAARSEKHFIIITYVWNTTNIAPFYDASYSNITTTLYTMILFNRVIPLVSWKKRCLLLALHSCVRLVTQWYQVSNICLDQNIIFGNCTSKVVRWYWHSGALQTNSNGSSKQVVQGGISLMLSHLGLKGKYLESQASLRLSQESKEKPILSSFLPLPPSSLPFPTLPRILNLTNSPNGT